MKKRFIFFFAVLMFDMNVMALKAFGVEYNTADTASIISSYSPERPQQKPGMYLNFSTGVILNQSFGAHPIFNVALGIDKKYNRYQLVYEHRFGNSKNSYQIPDNDTLKSVDTYKANFFGVEYQRIVFRNKYHEIYTNTGVGVDWIFIAKNESIQNNKVLSGLALNAGLGYALSIRGKHGPNVELLYHFANLKNTGGTTLNNNSLLIRLSYRFGNYSREH